jgi:hypothetical protein
MTPASQVWSLIVYIVSLGLALRMIFQAVKAHR